MNRSETLRRGFGIKGTVPWEHRENRKRHFILMVTSAESNIRSVSGDLLWKVGRLAVRLLLALSLIATITFVFFRLIHVNATSVGFFYLVAILVIATVGGFVEATVSSIFAMLCFNFFFFPPIGTLTIADPQNWVALFAFLVTALTASQLSDRLKQQRKEALDRQREMERLYALSRAILLTDTTQPTAKQIANQIANAFECPAVALYDRRTSEVYLAGPKAFPNIDGKRANSASGLDPQISPANAETQAARVAKARGVSADQVKQLIPHSTDPADLGFLGEPRVNVLMLNIALDQKFPVSK